MSIEKIKAYLNICKNHYPFADVYSACLDLLQERTGINRDNLRRKYGLFTGEQWTELLNLNK